MSRNDFFDIEDKIRNAVDSAFRYIDDYEGIKNNTLNEVRNHLRRSAGFAQETLDNINRRYREQRRGRMRYNNYNNVNNYNMQDTRLVSLYISPKPAGRISGILLSILGILGSIGTGIFLFLSLIAFFTCSDSVSLHICRVLIGSSSLAFVFNVSLAFIGGNIRKRIRRFKKYSAYIGDKKYCKIEELASFIGESSKFVIKDLEKMIKLNMFREAHIDDENTYFMLSNQVYDNYLKSKEAFNKRKEEEERVQNDTSELGTVIRMGKDYISQIRDANEAIPGEIISAKLDKLEKIVTAIFSNIEKNEKKIPDVKKFINHYLPMTLKLVNSYKELDSQVIQGENIKKAKLEIEKSIDLINTAFEKLLDDLFEDVAMDVSSDISVLETLFSQEGLTDDELRKKK